MNAMASALALLVFTIIQYLSFTTGNAVMGQSKRLVTKLIHRDSAASPYHNPEDTDADCMERTMESSDARVTYLYAKTARAFGHSVARFDLLPSLTEPLFLVNFSIGQPPVPQLTIMDTGSNLLWVQCSPSDLSSRKNVPMLNPSKSSSYANLSCDSSLCLRAPRGHCNSLNQCLYNQTYVAGPGSEGVLATEQIVFQTSDDGTAVVSDVVFGCSHANGNYKDELFTGVLGLGYELTSLAVQMGYKFSYCLGDVTNPSYDFNQLILGPGAEMEGYSTPLRVAGGHYYVTLEGISVGEKRLAVDFSNFTRVRKGSGTIIDSGTAPTYLADEIYRALDKEVRALLNGVLTPFQRGTFLCYRGRVSKDLTGFPVVTFHFAGGADLAVDGSSIFYQATTDVICMSIRRTSTYGNPLPDFSVIGLMAQQYYNIGYDLLNYKLYFQRIDCELLDD